MEEGHHHTGVLLPILLHFSLLGCHKICPGNMVEPISVLEDSTLELIRRRRTWVPLPGWVALSLSIGIIVAMPLIRVDLVTTSAGMIRPLTGPVEITAASPGISDFSALEDFLRVEKGDTLLVFSDPGTITRLENCRKLLKRNDIYIGDIRNLLDGKAGIESEIYNQSHRDYLSRLEQLTLEEKFQQDEFRTAELLYRQEVIPFREYEDARIRYLGICARKLSLKEEYRRHLESELRDLRAENLALHTELETARSVLNTLCITAPLDGTLQNCRQLPPGTAVTAGTCLGTLVPAGPLVAECFVEPEGIGQITTGTEVKIRMHGKASREGKVLRGRVTGKDADAIVVNGRPVFRVRCVFGEYHRPEETETLQRLQPGMTFSATMVLDRASLASLVSEKLFRWSDPYRAGERVNSKTRNGT
jgi:multidrug resistance efflux pump